jgi:hypothetical protein
VGAATATLLQGSGIFPYLDGTDLKFGLLMGDQDPASAVLDYSAAGSPANPFAIYVRAVYNPATIQNRVFWNPSGSPAAEFIDNVSTRDVATWEVLSQDSTVASPGSGEWMKIYEITVVANLITVVTDFRHFFYEGSAHASDAYAQEWGDGASDRMADRTIAPVTDLHRLGQLVRRQLTDIIGAASGHWGSAVPRHLTDLAVQHLSGGNHGDIVAYEIKTPSAPGAGEGIWMDGLAFPIAGSNARMGSIRTKMSASTPALTFEACGRIAYPHRFFDDFHYADWVSFGTAPGHRYTVLRTGVAEDIRQLPAGATPMEHGGVVAIQTTANAADSASIAGSASWVLDSDISFLGFYARIALDLAASATRIDAFGLAQMPGGGTWVVRFVRDQGRFGDGNWRFEVDDGAAGPWVGVTGIGPTANIFQNFYWVCTGEDSFDFWVEGMAAPVQLDISPGTIAGLAQRSAIFLSTSNNAVATAIESYVDYWEIWDSAALTEAQGNNG